jgi:putative ABC transport system ATP-binding protein
MLELNAVSKSYESLSILKNINMEIKSGEFVAIMGPSGSGKSTLLGIAAGLDFPDSGTVKIDSVNLKELSEDKLSNMRSQKIGFIFQNFQLIKTLTAWENICLPLLFNGESKESNFKDRAKELLEKVSLLHRMEHFPSQLSGGEEQRVAIARAFINNPKILFADEPTGNLDSKNGEAVMKMLRNLNRENRSTLLIVTHDPNVAKLADRVIEMEDGSIVTKKTISKKKSKKK